MERSSIKERDEKLKAIVYEIEISESWLHSSHGITSTINEIYIPKFRIFINYGGIWKFVKGRYKNATKIKEMEIPIITGKFLSDSLKHQEESKRIAKKLLKEAEKK